MKHESRKRHVVTISYDELRELLKHTEGVYLPTKAATVAESESVPAGTARVGFVRVPDLANGDRLVLQIAWSEPEWAEEQRPARKQQADH